MPLIGSFHTTFWKARAAGPVGSGGGSSVSYVPWMSSVIMGSLFGALEAFTSVWAQIRWCWALVRRVWRYRDPAMQARIEQWLLWSQTADVEHLAILARVITALSHPSWPDAQALVRACATSPKFHQPEQWVEYSRAVKTDAGHAQNVFRHMKVVLALKAADPAVSNPDAHLLAELAYQGLAALGRSERRLIDHPKVVTN